MHTRALVFLATLAAALVAGCGPTAYKITPISASDRLMETTVRSDPGILLPKIALIDIEGMILNVRKGGLFAEDENPVSLAVEKVQETINDPAVKAVVLRINSPGGGVTASDIIYREVLKLRNGTPERPGKPVVAMIMDVGASGGYYIACAGNEIVAEPTCVTGSIGVIMLKFNLEGLLGKIGVGTEPIKSGAFKDAGSPFRPLKPAEAELFQKIIDGFYEDFVTVVASSRDKLTVEKVRELADGRVYSGRQAADLGLVDRLGSLDTAIDRAKELGHVKAARIVMYHRPVGYRGSIYSTTPAVPNDGGERPGSLIRVTLPDAFISQGYFMYLWQP